MNLNDHLKTLETPGIPEAQRWLSLAVILRAFMESNEVDLDYDPDIEEKPTGPDTVGWWVRTFALSVFIVLGLVAIFWMMTSSELRFSPSSP